MKMSSKNIGIVVGGLALSLSVGAGPATAAPDYGPMLDTTCNYDQAIAAVKAENPVAAPYLLASAPNLQFLRVYLSSSRDQRINLLDQISGNEGAGQALPVFQQMLTSCDKY